MTVQRYRETNQDTAIVVSGNTELDVVVVSPSGSVLVPMSKERVTAATVGDVKAVSVLTARANESSSICPEGRTYSPGRCRRGLR